MCASCLLGSARLADFVLATTSEGSAVPADSGKGSIGSEGSEGSEGRGPMADKKCSKEASMSPHATSGGTVAAATIELHNFEVWWPGANAPAVVVPALSVCPGQLAAIYGGVGSGKSSLLLGMLSGEQPVAWHPNLLPAKCLSGSNPYSAVGSSELFPNAGAGPCRRAGLGRRQVPPSTVRLPCGLCAPDSHGPGRYHQGK